MAGSAFQEVEFQREYYEKTAQQYNQMHVDEKDEHFFALSFLAAALDYIPAKSVLDVGSGTGRAMCYIKQRRADVRLVGVEPVEELRRIGYAHGLSTDELIAGDATRLQFDNEEFDVVCEFGVLHHLRNPDTAVAEMLRVAKKAVFISDSNNFGQGSFLVRSLKQLLNSLGLWQCVNFLKTKGKGYSISEGDGLAYSYSVFDNYKQLRVLQERPCPQYGSRRREPVSLGVARRSSRIKVMSMRVLFNATTLVKGGSLQVASSFLLRALGQPGPIEWGLALSDAVYDELRGFPVNVPDTIYRFPQSPSRNLASRRALGQLVETFQPDCVFTLFGPAYVRFPVPHLVGVANPWVTHSTWTAYRTLVFPHEWLKVFLSSTYTAYWYRQADAWVVEADCVKQGLHRRLHLPLDKIAVVPNTCGDHYRDGTGSPTRDHPLADKPIRILSFAAAYKHKNLAIIPDVAKAGRPRAGSALPVRPHAAFGRADSRDDHSASAAAWRAAVDHQRGAHSRGKRARSLPPMRYLLHAHRPRMFLRHVSGSDGDGVTHRGHGPPLCS